jgi:hypothetical protein
MGQNVVSRQDLVALPFLERPMAAPENQRRKGQHRIFH